MGECVPAEQPYIEQLYTGERLSDNEIAYLNEHFTIEIYTGVHGQALAAPNDLLAVQTAPTQLEYQAAARVVESLGSDDTLFIEGIGHDVRSYEPVPSTGPYSKTDEELDAVRSEAVALAEQYKINARDYSISLAIAQRMRIVYADIDYFEKGRLETTAGKRWQDIARQETDQDAELWRDFNMQRERAATRKMVKQGLEYPSAVSSSEKTKLVLIFGGGHKDGIRQAFEELGVPISLYELEESTQAQRLSEQLDRLKRAMASELLKHVLDRPGNTDTGADSGA